MVDYKKALDEFKVPFMMQKAFLQIAHTPELAFGDDEGRSTPEEEAMRVALRMFIEKYGGH